MAGPARGATPDFSAAHAVLQAQVDSVRLPGASAATLHRGELLHSFCTGWADLEAQVPLRPDHIHRAYSNTKLITSVLVLRLLDLGHFALDDPISRWIPAFAHTRVLRAGAATLDDTEPLQTPITIRHLLSHQAGLSHGVFDPGTVIYAGYMASGVRRPDVSLAQAAERLAALPLVYQPGTAWEYSLAPDVLARLVEIVTGQSFGVALQQQLFEPLGMVDTAHVLRPEQHARFTALYTGNIANPLESGLRRMEDAPWPGAYVQAVAREGGASGLFTTQADMLALLRTLLPGPDAFLKPATLAEMFRDQLPPDVCVQFPQFGALPGLGFGLGGAFTRRALPLQPLARAGELQWGGLAGTHWWLSPETGVAGVVMTQRFFGWWNPFWWEYRQRMDEALAGLA